jgi:NTP pyrophosphatase (non-canonical NTP hydrolase)
MLNEIEHLLVCLSEECAEVAKETDKALRFGLDDRNPEIENDEPQREHIRLELCDLLAVIEMLIDKGAIADPRKDLQRIFFKKARVVRFMRYAQDAGALEKKS